MQSNAWITDQSYFGQVNCTTAGAITGLECRQSSKLSPNIFPLRNYHILLNHTKGMLIFPLNWIEYATTVWIHSLFHRMRRGRIVSWRDTFLGVLHHQKCMHTDLFMTLGLCSHCPVTMYILLVIFTTNVLFPLLSIKWSMELNGPLWLPFAISTRNTLNTTIRLMCNLVWWIMEVQYYNPFFQ